MEDIFGNEAILYQNTPNPFTSTTEIKYHLPEEENDAYICIYDMQGKQLSRYKIEDKGDGSIIIDGSTLHPGMFIYTLIVKNHEVSSKRMIPD